VKLRQTDRLRILDFDIETVAAGFADPEWVPQKITCVAWSWLDSDEVESRICGPGGIFGYPNRRAKMLKPLLEAIGKADMVTGHNIIRFDLPVINAEAMRLGLPPIREKRVQDTIRFIRSKGFKKGQDVLGSLLRLNQEKLSLNWQDWQDAYDDYGWKTVRQRAESDVLMHKELRAELLNLDILKPPTLWRG
jgi:DNA polymerase elongation subunit (family B)